MTRLSVCIIARNEATRIARAIESVKPVADEVVVTDTGSTDDTPAIAASLGAVVHHFAWVDDFAAAYNACTAQATGDWVLQLDADEELKRESRDEVRRCVARTDALAFTVLREDLADSIGGVSGTKMRLPRLFRNVPEVRFVGRIHHQFTPPLNVLSAKYGKGVFASTIELRHDGYVGVDKRAKLERAARLMELELRDRPGQFYFLVELGRSYDALKDPRGTALLAEAAAMAAASHAEAEGGTLAMLLEWVLAQPQLPADFPLSPDAAGRIALRLFPDSVPLRWQLARRAFERERYADAAAHLEHIGALAEHEAYDTLASFDPRIMRDEAKLNLGACYVRLNRLREAEACFKTLLSSKTVADRAAGNLRQVRELRR